MEQASEAQDVLPSEQVEESQDQACFTSCWAKKWQDHVHDLFKVLHVSKALWLELNHHNEALLRIGVEIATCEQARKALWWTEHWWEDEERREWFRAHVNQKLSLVLEQKGVSRAQLALNAESNDQKLGKEKLDEKKEKLDEKKPDEAASDQRPADGQQRAETEEKARLAESRCRQAEKSLFEANDKIALLEYELEKKQRRIAFFEQGRSEGVAEPPAAEDGDMWQDSSPQHDALNDAVRDAEEARRVLLEERIASQEREQAAEDVRSQLASTAEALADEQEAHAHTRDELCLVRNKLSRAEQRSFSLQRELLRAPAVSSQNQSAVELAQQPKSELEPADVAEPGIGERLDSATQTIEIVTSTSNSPKFVQGSPTHSEESTKHSEEMSECSEDSMRHPEELARHSEDIAKHSADIACLEADVMSAKSALLNVEEELADTQSKLADSQDCVRELKAMLEVVSAERDASTAARNECCELSSKLQEQLLAADARAEAAESRAVAAALASGDNRPLKSADSEAAENKAAASAPSRCDQRRPKSAAAGHSCSDQRRPKSAAAAPSRTDQRRPKSEDSEAAKNKAAAAASSRSDQRQTKLEGQEAAESKAAAAAPSHSDQRRLKSGDYSQECNLPAVTDSPEFQQKCLELEKTKAAAAKLQKDRDELAKENARLASQSLPPTSQEPNCLKCLERERAETAGAKLLKDRDDIPDANEQPASQNCLKCLDLEQAKAKGAKLRKDRDDLAEEKEQLTSQNFRCLKMIHNLKEALNSITALAERRGLGHIAADILNESGIVEQMESKEFQNFGRLWDDAQRRIAKQRELDKDHKAVSKSHGFLTRQQTLPRPVQASQAAQVQGDSSPGAPAENEAKLVEEVVNASKAATPLSAGVVLESTRTLVDENELHGSQIATTVSKRSPFGMRGSQGFDATHWPTSWHTLARFLPSGQGASASTLYGESASPSRPRTSPATPHSRGAIMPPRPRTCTLHSRAPSRQGVLLRIQTPELFVQTPENRSSTSFRALRGRTNLSRSVSAPQGKLASGLPFIKGSSVLQSPSTLQGSELSGKHMKRQLRRSLSTGS